jgi:hypothetical protein
METIMTKTAKTAKTAKPAKLTRVEHLHQMLSRAGGSSVAEIAEAFGGWEHHSCRGLISTGRRKLGWNVTTARADDGRGTVYSIAADRPQAEVSAKASATAKPETKAKGKTAKPKAKRARASA